MDSNKRKNGVKINYNLPENHKGHPETSLLPWYSGDLRTRLMLAARYTERILDRDFDNHPHFHYGLNEESGCWEAMGSKGWGMSHSIGRAMDLLLNLDKYAKLPLSHAVEEEYTRHFFNYLDEDFGMSLEYEGEVAPMRIQLHNTRETIEALALLVEIRGDQRALNAIDHLLDALPLITDRDMGGFSAEVAKKSHVEHRFDSTINGLQPGTAGRMIGPLMEIYRVTGDERALDLAGVYTKGTLNCFTREGEVLESAGQHVHSITSSLSGIADYATATRNQEIIDTLQRIYKNPKGLPMMMSTYGWVKEHIFMPGDLQGESNQIGDMIQFYMLMADYEESAEWLSRAETSMRSALLPSQILESDFLEETREDGSDATHAIKSRILGGFGFPMPSSHMCELSKMVNTLDITQGACQAIDRFMAKIAVRRNGAVYIQFLFDVENDVVILKSQLPKEGHVIIIPKTAGNFYIRLPENCEDFRFLLDGHPIDYIEYHGFAKLWNLRRGDVVTFLFQPKTTVYHEMLIGTEYTIIQYGEQVVEATPIDGIYPLYYNFLKD